uniref:hypothetical protein n=1 Tax=Nonomuraea sp. CA-251285 TaxID=3240002 RepID=UPI003F4992E4
MTRPAPASALKVGTRPLDGRYEGALRRGRMTVWACGHHHHNRDISTGANGTSATDCVTVRVRAVRNATVGEEWCSTVRRNARATARLIGVSYADSTRMLEQAEQAIAAFNTEVAALAALIGDEPVYGGGRSTVITPPPPTGVCPACGVEVMATHWYGATPPSTNWAELNPGRVWEPWGSWRSVAYTYATGHVWCKNGLDHEAPQGAMGS